MMKRVWRISHAARAELVLYRWSGKPKTLVVPSANLARICTRTLLRDLSTQSDSCQNPFPDIIGRFSDQLSPPDIAAREDLSKTVTELSEELIQNVDDSDGIVRILEEKGAPLFRKYYHLSAFLELLKKLRPCPHLGIQVFYWRRQWVDSRFPMMPEEYTKCIAFAGRIRNVDLALELFTEATNKRMKNISMCNALMAAYMFNGHVDKCQLLFRELKSDAHCCPTIVTYNILISVFGRLMLVDHMEAVFQEIQKLNLSPNVGTFNNLIAGYLTAWMWDSMEKTYETLKESTINPDTNTHFLMLQGYATAGNLEKMEKIYELVKDHVNQHEMWLIRAMICAYCKSLDENRVQKVEALLSLIPERDYRPWLNVLLIKLYAQEDLLEDMENSINQAFDNNTVVATVHVMRGIITSYFRRNAVDKLACFVKRAEHAGWRICRSLYHCKMVMYGSQKRLEEMERVLHELDHFNFRRTQSTLWILYHAYTASGEKYKLQQVLGLMCKNGYNVPLDAFPS